MTVTNYTQHWSERSVTSNPACVCWTEYSGLWGSGWCSLGQDRPRYELIWCTGTRRPCWPSQTCPAHTHTHTHTARLEFITHSLITRHSVLLYIPCPPDSCLDGISGPIWNTLSWSYSLHAYKSTHTNHQRLQLITTILRRYSVTWEAVRTEVKRSKKLVTYK